MYNYTLSFIAGLIAMLCASGSYFLKRKALFLMAQASAITLLGVACLFNVQFYACISYGIALIRVMLYFALESKGKSPTMWLRSLFAFLSVLMYVVTNVIILKDARPIDIMLVVANCMFSFVFAIKDLKVLRAVILIPLLLCFAYFILTKETLFVIISYGIEAFANAFAIVLYKKRKKTTVNA